MFRGSSAALSETTAARGAAELAAATAAARAGDLGQTAKDAWAADSARRQEAKEKAGARMACVST